MIPKPFQALFQGVPRDLPDIGQGVPSPFQGVPRHSKPFQAFFSEKKDCLFFMSHFPNPAPVEPRLPLGLRQSSAAFPSTVSTPSILSLCPRCLCGPSFPRQKPTYVNLCQAMSTP